MGYSASNHYGFMFTDKYMRRRFEQYLSLMSNDIENGAEILDVGGYMGDLFEVMKHQHMDTEKIRYTIVDYDDSALEVARSRGAITHKIDFNYQSIDELVGEKRFDYIVCTEVLEHLLDPVKHISSFPKLLKPDGKCIISLPNENTIFHRIFTLTGMGIDQCVFELYKHLHFPTIKQNRRFVSRHLDIEKEIYYINFGGKNSRLSWVGNIFTIIPDGIWQGLTNIFPGLLARGVIFKLTLKDK